MYSANVDPTRRYLYLQVLGGKAFLEHLQEGDPLPGQVTSTFALHINFRGQRFKSRPVPCACEPDIQEGFLLEIHRECLGIVTKNPKHVIIAKTYVKFSQEM